VDGCHVAGASHQVVARRLVVTWQHPITRAIQPVGLLAFNGSRYSFCYIENARKAQDFRPLLGFPDLAERYESDSLFPLFAQRVMDPRRPDYQRYVHRLGLDSDATPWEQIARSGGRRLGDTLQLFPEPTITNEELSCAFLVHGIRHIPGREIEIARGAFEVTMSELQDALGALQTGDKLQLFDEVANPVNPRAIITASPSGIPLGWVPDLLVADLHKLIDLVRVDVSVLRINGPDAPWHLRLLANLSARVPVDFRFFTDRIWMPICESPPI
jgi:hypothetical protein